MIKRIAIPIENGMLSDSFTNCDHYQIYKTEDNSIVSKEIEKADQNELKLSEWISQKNITDIIAYKIEAGLIDSLAGQKINLFIGIPINTPDKIISDYLNGDLKSDNKIIIDSLHSESE